MSSILVLVCVGIILISFVSEVPYPSGWEHVKLFFVVVVSEDPYLRKIGDRVFFSHKNSGPLPRKAGNTLSSLT